MPELLVDFITSLDGYGAAEGWPGFWGLQGPEYLAWLGGRPERDYTILMGANTYRLMSGFAAEVETLEADEADAMSELARTPKVVFSSTLRPRRVRKLGRSALAGVGLDRAVLGQPAGHTLRSGCGHVRELSRRAVSSIGRTYSPRLRSVRRSLWLKTSMSHRPRPPASAMKYRSSKAISFMKPRVLRLAVLASRTLSGSSSENVSVGRLSARSSVSMASTR